MPLKPEVDEGASSSRPGGLRRGPEGLDSPGPFLGPGLEGRFKGTIWVQENLTPPACASEPRPGLLQERLGLAALQPSGRNPRPRRALPLGRGDARCSPQGRAAAASRGCGRAPPRCFGTFSVPQTELRNPKAPLLSLLTHLPEREERRMGTGSRAKFASSCPCAQKQVSFLTFSPSVTLGCTAAL